ncbi:hypothetical protein OAK51_04045 [Alphaproteobacteria bacterium]|nr:hypothetical protein [Alphaproteobacteria bacterium]
MTNELKFGIQTNGIKHTHIDQMPSVDDRFRMVKDTGIFDYVDKTPEVNEINDFKLASQNHKLPIRAGGWFYTIGNHKSLLEKNLKIAKDLGSQVHNVQIQSKNSLDKIATDQEVRDTYLEAYDIGMKFGVIPCFEIHVNMWSEDFLRVSKVGKLVEEKGIEFNLTLDHSHVIFKIDNPKEQKIFNIDQQIKNKDLILDPFVKGNVVEEWIENGWVRHCHARSAIPNNPINIYGKHPDGNFGRGIQYPFKKPNADEYHELWEEKLLDPWKECVLKLMRYHLKDPNSKLGQISTEFIPNTDYGEGCKYSLFEQAIECTNWMRKSWNKIKKEY